jgi:hypothetical protein
VWVDWLPFRKPAALVQQKGVATALASKYPSPLVVAVCGQPFAAEPANAVVLM